MTELSVVIPARRRPDDLRACLDALARQTEPAESYEVIVVDVGAADATAELLASYSAPFRLRIEHAVSGPSAAARRHGTSVAAGTYCLFIDADVIADPSLIEEHLRAQRDSGGALALGALRLRPPSSRSGLAASYARDWNERNGRLGAGDREPTVWDCHGTNFSAPTSAVRAAGTFDEDPGGGEEIELAYRLERAGLPIVHLPRAGAERASPYRFLGVVKEVESAGAAAAVVCRRHPELLPSGPLGDFHQGWTVTILVRRLLLAVRAPVWPFRLIDLLAPGTPERLYRLLRLHCLWRGARRGLDDRDTWRRLTRGTVILMYHAIGGREDRPSRFVLPASRFRRQLAWLRLRGYPVLSLDEYARHRAENRLPPARSVVITFDDGYADNAELALPMLRTSDMPAAVFVVTGSVGAVNGWDAGKWPLAGRRLLSWEDLRTLRGRGIEIGAHTVSHPQLTELGQEAAHSEVAESRAELERELGSPVRHFAYPSGKTSAEVADVVRSAGFATACGIQAGPNGPAVPMHELRRLEVRGSWWLPRFAISLWVGRPFPSPRREGP